MYLHNFSPKIKREWVHWDQGTNEVSANHLGSEAQIFGGDALTIFGFAFNLLEIT